MSLLCLSSGPDEISLEVRIHDVGALNNPPIDVMNCSVFVSDQKIVDGVVTPRFVFWIQTFDIFVIGWLIGLLSFHCAIAPCRLRAGQPAHRFGSVRRNLNAVSTRRGCLRCIAMPSQ